jgi:hypothetical protein
MVDWAANTNSVTTSSGIRLAAFSSNSLRSAPFNDWIEMVLANCVCHGGFPNQVPLWMGSGSRPPGQDPDDNGYPTHHTGPS